jgi:Fe-S cluster biogenesis protein NfuA
MWGTASPHFDETLDVQTSGGSVRWVSTSITGNRSNSVATPPLCPPVGAVTSPLCLPGARDPAPTTVAPVELQVLQAPLEELRALLTADGGDIELDRFDEEALTLRLRLVLESAACEECVMPATVLEDIALGAFQRAGAPVDRVIIDDPRENEA